MSQTWEMHNSLHYWGGPAGVHLSDMSRKWWRSKAHAAASPATSSLLMKSRLWFAGSLVYHRLLGYQHQDRINACLTFVCAADSLSVCCRIGHKAFLQTVCHSWKLWSLMLRHHREKMLSIFSTVASLQGKKNIYIYILQSVCFVCNLSHSCDKD